MRLCTIFDAGVPVAAELVDDRIYRLNQSNGEPAKLLDLVQDPGALAAVTRASAMDVVDADFAAPWSAGVKLMGIGLNFAAHARDLEADQPPDIPFYLKGDHTVIEPNGTVELPLVDGRVTAEAELGVVIGAECYRCSPDQARESVFGVTCVLDQTAEGMLRRNLRSLMRSKNFPGFFAFGPEIVTVDEYGSLDRDGNITIETLRDDGERRNGSVAQMLRTPAEIISDLSQVMPLKPGDVVATGTPGALELRDGSRVACRISGLTELSLTASQP